MPIVDNNIFYSVDDDDLENYDPELEEDEDYLEPDEDEHRDMEPICHACNGSGESPFSSNGVCHNCHGRGTK